MKMLKITFLASVAWPWSARSVARCRPTSQPPKPSMADAEKTMAKLSQLVGGTWINTDPKFVVENRYEWAFGNKVIRGLGVTERGAS